MGLFTLTWKILAGFTGDPSAIGYDGDTNIIFDTHTGLSADDHLIPDTLTSSDSSLHAAFADRNSVFEGPVAAPNIDLDSAEVNLMGAEGPNGGPNPDPDRVFADGDEYARPDKGGHNNSQEHIEWVRKRWLELDLA